MNREIKKITFCLLGILTLISCTETSKYTQYINEQLGKYYPNEMVKYEYIAIIPRQGCHACIQAAEAFFSTTKESMNYFFIFTKLDSEKKLGLEIGKENLTRENVGIDKDDVFYNNKYYDSNYPLLLHKEADGTFSYKKLVSN